MFEAFIATFLFSVALFFLLGYFYIPKARRTVIHMLYVVVPFAGGMFMTLTQLFR